MRFISAMCKSRRPEKVMTKRRLIFIFATTALAGALLFTAARAHDVPKVATGFIANVVCTETFVSGLDPKKTSRKPPMPRPGRIC